MGELGVLGELGMMTDEAVIARKAIVAMAFAAKMANLQRQQDQSKEVIKGWRPCQPCHDVGLVHLVTLVQAGKRLLLSSTG